MAADAMLTELYRMGYKADEERDRLLVMDVPIDSSPENTVHCADIRVARARCEIIDALIDMRTDQIRNGGE